MMQNISRVALLSIRSPVTLRCFAAAPKKTLGDEKNYILKQEQALLKNLLKKVKEQAVKADASEEKLAEVCDKEIRELCAKFAVKTTDSLVKDLLKWKAEK